MQLRSEGVRQERILRESDTGHFKSVERPFLRRAPWNEKRTDMRRFSVTAGVSWVRHNRSAAFVF